MKFKVASFALAAAFSLLSPVFSQEISSSYNSEALWALVLLPDDGSDAWVHWASTGSPLRLTVALSPKDIRKIAVKENLLLSKNNGIVEIAARLNDDPPLPLIYDSEMAMNFLSPADPIQAAQMNYADDVTGQIARARLAHKNFFGQDPKGFVSGNGSLSLPVVDALKAQNFAWTAGSFPENEWKRGGILTASTAQEKMFWVYAADPISDALHDPKRPLGSPKKNAAETEEIVSQMFRQISESNREGVTPLVVFDEKRAAISLDAFLSQCAEQLKSREKWRMIHAGDIGYVADSRTLSNSLQVWPYSWNWIVGLGDPHGPGLAAWIGDPAKTNAWRWLAETREKIELYKNSGAADLKKLDLALNEIYEAQSGDYFEWFGSLESWPADAQNALRAKQREKEWFFKATLSNVYRHLNLSAPEVFKAGKMPESFSARAATSAARAQDEDADIPARSSIHAAVDSNAATWTPVATDETGSEVKKAGSLLRRLSVKSGGKVPAEIVEFEFTVLDSPETESSVVDLYIDINHRDNAGRTALLPGRKASVSGLDAWEYALVCKRIAGTKDWDCKLFRSQSSNPVFQAKARPRADKAKTLSWDVKIPRSLVGKDPLRWGYLTCIIKAEDEPIADFLSPVRNKQKILAEFESLSEKPQAQSSIVLPMLRVPAN